MNDLRYQVELLSALNDKLTTKEKMCDFILNTSSGAFIYQEFEETKIQVMGNWDQFFNFQFKIAVELVIQILNLREGFEISKQRFLVGSRCLCF